MTPLKAEVFHPKLMGSITPIYHVVSREYKQGCLAATGERGSETRKPERESRAHTETKKPLQRDPSCLIMQELSRVLLSLSLTLQGADIRGSIRAHYPRMPTVQISYGDPKSLLTYQGHWGWKRSKSKSLQPPTEFHKIDQTWHINTLKVIAQHPLKDCADTRKHEL